MNQVQCRKLQEIYNALGDDISRSVFKHRLLYAFLKDKNEIAAMVNQCSAMSGNFERNWFNSPKICYYGAGAVGSDLLEYYSDVPFVIDTYKTGTLKGKPIISLADFMEMPDCKEYLIIIAIGNELIRQQIETELKARGLRYLPGFFGVQYFDLPCLDLNNEFFVDAGAMDGETTQFFIENYKNSHAYVLEPNPVQFSAAKKRLAGYRNVEFYPFGVYDDNVTLSFDSNAEFAGSAKITEAGDISVDVRRLDDLLQGKPVTFIKMDIEGSELAALRGAKEIICTQKPKLAICVYHKPEDIWEIPDLLLKYCPDYKFYLRHYSMFFTETVLYAVKQEN